MPFTPKNWVDSPSTSTPITAAALEDMEERVTDYTDNVRNLFVQEDEPTDPPVGSLWIPLNPDQTPRPMDEWEVYT